MSVVNACYKHSSMHQISKFMQQSDILSSCGQKSDNPRLGSAATSGVYSGSGDPCYDPQPFLFFVDRYLASSCSLECELASIVLFFFSFRIQDPGPCPIALIAAGAAVCAAVRSAAA